MSTQGPNIGLNIHVYPSYLTNESRILRECQSLIELGIVGRVVVVGYWKTGLAKKEEVRPNVFFVRLKPLISKGSGRLKFLNFLSFPLFYLGVMALCKAERPRVINCHSLTVLPLGYIIKKLYHASLVYDPHELETETNEARGLRKVISKGLERLFIVSADEVITVSNLIAEWYQDRYGLKNVRVIRNIPSGKIHGNSSTVLRQVLQLPDDAILFLYVGALENGRGIELLLQAFVNVEEAKHLVFLGYGSLKSRIAEVAKLSSNIHCVDAVSPDQVLSYISGADVGICLIENSCLSYYYCLPNKGFEYLSAGIPFISSNFPELKREFGSSGICWFADLQFSKIHDIVKGISLEDIGQKKTAVMRNRMNWDWSEEQLKYKTIYSSLI